MELVTLVSEEVTACDLAAYKNPFLPKTFTKWRRSILKGPPSAQFLLEVDEQLLPRFLEKVLLRYHAQLTQSQGTPELDLSPVLLQHVNVMQAYQEVAMAIAGWNTEIELAMDVVERAKAYGLYEMPGDLRELYTDLQQEWAVEEEPTARRLYRFLVHLMAYATDSLSSITKRHIVKIASFNLLHAKSSILSGVLSAYMYGSFPWPVLALLGSQLGFMASGWLALKLGRGVSERVDSLQVRGHLKELAGKFAGLREDLKAVNARATELIRHAVTDHTGQDELASLLNGFLVKKQDESVYRLMQASEEPEELLFYEDEDWLVMDFGPN